MKAGSMKNAIRLFIPFTAIILLISGCQDQRSFEELSASLPVVKHTRTHIRSNMKYRISLPAELKLIDKQYSDTAWVELYVDTTVVYESGPPMLSVSRYYSKAKTPEEAWKQLIRKRSLMEDLKVYSEGETNFLSYPSYYEHSSTKISNKPHESVSFILQGKSSDFYLISIQAINAKTYPENMQRLLACARTFELIWADPLQQIN